jgi:hypothetical protein
MALGTNQRNPGLDGITFVPAVDHAYTEPMTSIANLIQQHLEGTAVVERDDVRIAVVVEVSCGGATRDLQL